MANETLSAKQASNILTQVRDTLNKCEGSVGSAIADFVNVVKTNWEDKNAVEFGKHIGKVFGEIHSTLGKNQQTFSKTLGEIAQSYVKAGGMQGYVQDLPTDVRIAENGLTRALGALSQIKEFFPDGDNFGFRDIDKSSEVITQAFTDLKTSLKQSALTVQEETKRINAFGNINVQLNLAASAGSIVTIMTTSIEELQKALNETLDATKQQYKSVGSNAEGAAKISAN